MVKTHHLAFDLGAETGRAVVGIIKGDQLIIDEIHRFSTSSTFINDSLRVNIISIYNELLNGMKKYVEKYGPDLDSIGIDTWGVDFGLLDKNGKLLNLPYQYRDKKNDGSSKIISEVIGDRRLYDLTGIQLLFINTLNQIVGSQQLKDSSLDFSYNILLIGDLLHYFLTGRIATEFTTVSITQLYNTVTKDWEDEIFEAFNINKNIKTEIIQAGDLIGPLKNHICLETGLTSVPVIAPAVHDTASAAVAVPVPGLSDWAYISSGTWSIVGLELDAPVVNDASFEMNISNSGGVLGKSLFLKNVMGLWIIQECKRIWNLNDIEITYKQIVDLAEKATPFNGFIDPDDPVFNHPQNAPQEVCNYLVTTGQSEVDPDNIGGIARIVFECLALKYKHILNGLISASGKKVTQLFITGGGSKNNILNQFTSNALNQKVFCGPQEATAIGNIMMQAYGLNLYNSLDEIRTVIGNSITISEYQPQDPELWEKASQKFLIATNIHNKSDV
jgi:rhamnulokinase